MPNQLPNVRFTLVISKTERGIAVSRVAEGTGQLLFFTQLFPLTCCL